MTPQEWSGVVGLFMPLLVEIVKTKLPQTRIWAYSASLVICILVGGLTALFAGQLGAKDILVDIMVALTASQTVYQYWFKDSQLETKIAG